MPVTPPSIRPSGTIGIGGSLARPKLSPSAATKGITSISQLQQSSHVYQIGDRTSMHSSNDTAGSHGVGSIAQVLKKGGLAGSGPIKPSGGTRPIMSLIK